MVACSRPTDTEARCDRDGYAPRGSARELVPDTHDGRARHEIGSEGIEHALALSSGQAGGRLVCVPHEVVAEFMRETVPAPSGVRRSVDDCYPQAVHLN